MYKRSYIIIFIYKVEEVTHTIFNKGGMSLKIIRMLQRIIGVLLLVYGVYLIFGTQEFFGTILIILAFLIFPTLSKNAQSGHHDDYDHNPESTSTHDHSYESHNSAGESGD